MAVLRKQGTLAPQVQPSEFYPDVRVLRIGFVSHAAGQRHRSTLGIHFSPDILSLPSLALFDILPLILASRPTGSPRQLALFRVFVGWAVSIAGPAGQIGFVSHNRPSRNWLCFAQ
jgi:hypothetical protein